jgi:histidinol dehydrogenase
MRVRRTEWDGRDAAAAARTLRAAVPDPEQVAGTVAGILREVEARGDEALRELSRRLNGVERSPESLQVDPSEVARAAEGLSGEIRDAMRSAAVNIRAVAQAELNARSPVEVEPGEGQRVCVVEAAVEAAGIYSPGGRAGYPSSVLMCCIPARVAGVQRIAVASPPGPNGELDQAVLAACSVAGVEEVHAIGGAQAIAALAFGTESVVPVDVVAGPGNRYVAEAKRLVSGRVGTDGIAGPSELVVVADEVAEPEWVALDVCAQAEHGTDGLLAVITEDGELLDRLTTLLPELAAARTTVSDASVALVRTPDADAALALADSLAPEHLELQLAEASESLARDRVAGCVFVGPAAGTAFGDYAAGSNHVLPTGGAARFGGPLGPSAFMRRTSIVSIPPPSAAALAPVVDALARAEGFPVHGESAEARSGDNGTGE